MREIALPNAAAHKITISSTSLSLQDAIRTAASSTSYLLPDKGDVLEIDVESGTGLRILLSGLTPTSTNGLYIAEGEFRVIEGVNLKDIRMIRTTGTDVVANIRIGCSDSGAKTASNRSAGAGVSASGADGVSNTLATSAVTARMGGFNGTTWDRIRAGITAVTATFTGFLNTLPWAIFTASPTTRTEGQGGPLQATALGAVHTYEAYGRPGENFTTNRTNVEEVWTPTPITTATTTNVLTGPGTFGGISLNKKVATGVITIYDALTATGTPKAIHTIGAAMLSDPGENLFKPMVMTVGCTIVTSQAFDLTAYTRLN
jgi:hypothetical protein